MPEEKGLGSKLLGLFVEVKDDGTPVEGTPAVERGDGEKSAAELVAENLRRAEAGEPLLHLVDRERGY